MAHTQPPDKAPILASHRNLLVAGAIFTTLLIAMGGILCVTQSIRNCPDWPGCFGRALPPAETGPVLEYTHRLLAGVSSLLIVSSAVVGMVRARQVRWVSIPPVLALVLLLEVSFFGAQVVLRGLSPGWAAVDVGSALLVVALMVAAAVKASTWASHRQIATQGFRSGPARLALAALAAVYVIYVSGILVAGKGSITSCLGWPIYNLQQVRLDGLTPGNLLRLVMSAAAVGLLVAVVLQAWRKRNEQKDIFRIARWLGLAIILETLLQVLIQALGLLIPLLLMYTVVAAALWALLAAHTVRASQQAA